MAAINGFDANTVEPTKPFIVLPAAKYVAAIVASEAKSNSKGNGSFLALTLQIVEGEHKGRKLFHNLNLNNPNAQAVEISKASLSAICRAIGIMQPKDSMELHNVPLLIDVKCRKRKDNGEMENYIANFLKNDGAAVAPEATAGTAAPWQR